MRIEHITLNEERNVTMAAYTQEVGGEFLHIPKRPAVIILPGGGYQFCSNREAEPAAISFLNAGYQVFILYYSLQKWAEWPNPLLDYEQAFRIICERSEEWGIYTDKVAVVGFSAGGHLAAATATMSEYRPNAAILGYPVINGETVKIYEKTAPSLIEQVDEKTPPCFIFATRTDETVSVINSIQFMEALTKKNISFESHIYSFGNHGFSTCDTSSQMGSREGFSGRVKNWVTDSIEWLREVFGDFGEGGLTEPKFGQYAMPVDTGSLSVNCSIAQIINNVHGAELFQDIIGITELKERFKIQVAAMGMDISSFGTEDDLVMGLKAIDALSLIGISSEELKKLDMGLLKLKK